MFEKINTPLKDCFEIKLKKLGDNRGQFIKSFHINAFKEIGIEMNFREEYFTSSVKNVFRGLHFQNPPKAIAKMVYCVNGQVSDYVVDIRKNSSTYGHWHQFELDGNSPSIVFVPEGFAHGFYVKSQNAIMQYKVSDVFDSVCDAGIDYKSFDFASQISNPIMSDRDKNFVAFQNFNSLF